jgi:hypothetical protein
MTQLTLWQKLEFIEDLTEQINFLNVQLEELNYKIELLKEQKSQELAEFDSNTRITLTREKKRKDFLNELLVKQNQEKEIYNQIVLQINKVIDIRLSDPNEFSKFNINPSNPKEIELIKTTLRQKLIARM